MYESVRRAQRIGEERRIVIDEVNTTKRIITGKDAYGSTVYVSFQFLEPIVTVPAQGELWTVKRYENEWRLDRKLVRGDDDLTPIDSMEPGDMRIETPGKLYLSGSEVIISGSSGSSEETGGASRNFSYFMG